MSILSDELREIIGRRYPTAPLAQGPLFSPMSRIDRGELSSGAPIEIARALKVDVYEVANALLAEMAQRVPAEWRAIAGYVVCEGAAPEVVHGEMVAGVAEALSVFRRQYDLAPEASSRAIRCLVPDVTEPVYARIRLVARAVMQALLAVVYEGECELWLAPEAPCRVSSPEDVLRMYRSAVGRILHQEDEVRLTISPDFAEMPAGRVTCVWTTHHFYERLSSSARTPLAEARTRGACVLKMPEDAWLLSRDRGLSGLLSRESLVRVVSHLESSQMWWRFLFHAASTIPSGDFDPEVSLFEESASPLWNLNLLRERYERFACLLPLPVTVDVAKQLTVTFARERALMMRGLCMPLFVGRALLCGEMSEWALALEDFSRRGHAFMNAPSTRQSLIRGEFSSDTREIIASLGFGLSSILALARLCAQD